MKTQFLCPFCDKPFENAQRRASHITKGHAGKQQKAYSALGVMERTAPRIPQLMNSPKVAAASAPAAQVGMSPLDHIKAAIQKTKYDLAAIESVIVRQEELLRERAAKSEELKILESTRERLQIKVNPVAAPADEAPAIARTA